LLNSPSHDVIITRCAKSGAKVHFLSEISKN
jgi:hypothetical protein